MLLHPVDFARQPDARASRALRTVLVFDVVESVRIMSSNEAAFVNYWRAKILWIRGLLLPQWRGRLVKSYGDGGLVEFTSAWDAVHAALELQRSMEGSDALMPSGARVWLRCGIHVCDLVIDELDVYGSGVNLAARIAAAADPGAVLISSDVQDRVVDGAAFRVVDLGEHWLKHFDQPQRLYGVSTGQDVTKLQSERAPGYEHRPAIAVLPLTSNPSDANASLLGHAIVDEIIATLAKSSHWRVISRLSTARCVDTPASVRLASVLGVQYIVTGSLSMAGDRALIRLQLSDMRTEMVLWSRDATFAPSAWLPGADPVIYELARDVGHRLLKAEVRRVSTLPFSTIEDYGLHIGAIALMHRLNRTDVDHAATIIDALEERHHRSPEPAAMRARLHAVRMVQSGCADPVGQARLAFFYACRALERDPTHAFAMPMAALLGAQSGQPLRPALIDAQRAVTEHPQEPLAHLALGMLRGYEGSVADYEHHAEEAAALSPIDPAAYIFYSVLASAKLSAGKTEEAAGAAGRAIDVNSTYSSAHLMMTAAQAMADRWELARESAQRFLALEPSFSVRRYVTEFGPNRPPNMDRRAEALREAGLPD